MECDNRIEYKQTLQVTRRSVISSLLGVVVIVVVIVLLVVKHFFLLVVDDFVVVDDDDCKEDSGRFIFIVIFIGQKKASKKYRYCLFNVLVVEKKGERSSHQIIIIA